MNKTMLTILIGILGNYWKELSGALIGLFFLIRYKYLKQRNQRLEQREKQRVVIDKVLETNKEIDKGTQEKKEKIDNAKDIKDIQEEWGRGLK